MTLTAIPATSAPHRPIMPREVVRFLRPKAGEVALDCTLGGGGHAEIILPRLLPGGRLIGIDVDETELRRTEARLCGVGFGPDVFTARHGNFRDVPAILAAERIAAVDLMIVDLGISAMQSADSLRGFSYKVAAPLDMRMNPEHGVPASELLLRLTEDELTDVLRANADEPHAALIARLLKTQPLTTSHALERHVRTGLARAWPDLGKAAVKMSVRRTFQAIRIAVNDEIAALDALLAHAPAVLRPDGRVVILTFHSGEDRRVKQAFRAGCRAGIFSEVARTVTRSSREETRSNRRSSSAKLRWAVRASGSPSPQT